MPDENISKVHEAEPFDLNGLGAWGNAVYMYIRQLNFPHTYEDRDKRIGGYSDRIEKMPQYYTRYMNAGAISVDMQRSWFRESSEDEIFAFLIEVLEADREVSWTGFRITATVKENGHTVWFMELFAKSENSDTKVYSGDKAPNVLSRRRCCQA